ncbi:anthranilate synthase component I [Leptolyngbya sp. FACHB-541]|uniref:anthranilate synthase component I n=1 Tax=Leptolyngbya sp. FACHB-541 TaxID=2692810 RepID=UPI0016882B36|nr:anthranilate synthase component I [Leptolyngbya sp. FACHB-541]MBD2000060.1 anthranilate synthase component I [Leptolyngbya sp. FACHB-541]
MLQSIQPWHWRSLPLNQRTGSDVFEALFHRPGGAAETGVGAIATLLESPSATSIPSASSLARYSICAGAPRFQQGKPQVWTPAVGKILPQLRQLLQHSTTLEIPDPELPFTGGWLGWLGYDLAWEIEWLPSLNFDPLPFPVAYWYEPDQFAILDHHSQTLWLAATHSSQLDTLQSRLENPPPAIPQSLIPNSHPLPTPHFHTSQADYEAAILQAKKYIQAGDIFQANLSLRFETHTLADNWSIYRALQQINPSPFASYWQTPWGAMISCSPERLVELRGREAQTRPIAGTRSRGNTPERDRQQAQDLLDNAKENAEHIMLVDLERNDLGRVCEWGSVTVDELLTIERYSHVMHLVSNVRGRLHSDCDAIALIRALFPGGTITGCPKVRCMEIIEELEPVRRSLFYGSCGYLDWRGNLDLNILIRTLLSAPASSLSGLTEGAAGDRGNVIWGQVGAGIVADSNPELEWFEALHKAQAQLAALAIKSRSVETYQEK